VTSILEEHFDEAQFLVTRLGRALDSPLYTLDEVAEGDEERLLAHVDGLVVAGPSIVETMLIPAMLEGPAPAATAAAMAVLSADEPPVREKFFEHAAEMPEELSSGWVEALARSELIPDARILAGIHGPHAKLCLGALAFRGATVDPNLLDAVDVAEAPGELSALLRAQRAQKRQAARVWPVLEHHPVLAVAEHALEVALLTDDRSAWGAVQRACRAAEPLTPRALQIVAALGRPEDVRALASGLEDPARRRDIVFALGFAGFPEIVSALLGCLDDDAINPVAAEAYAAITGFDAARARAVVRRPDPESLPPLEEDDLDADLGLDPDAELEAVDPAILRRHWSEHRGQFTQGQRYLRGQALTPELVAEAVVQEPTRRRAFWARELWFRTGGRTHVAVRAGTARQRRQMGR